MKPFWDGRVAWWVSRQIWGDDRGFGECVALGVANRKMEIIAGLVFHNWEPEAGIIEVSGAATDPRWMTRRVMNVALGYAFDDAGCQMVVARQSLENKAPRRAWKALGAQEIIIPRMRGRDEDGLLITLTDDAWRSSRFYEGQDHVEAKSTKAA